MNDDESRSRVSPVGSSEAEDLQAPSNDSNPRVPANRGITAASETAGEERMEPEHEPTG